MLKQKIVTVTPSMAAGYLVNCDLSKPLDMSNLARIQSSFRTRPLMNTCGFSFDRSGKLLDGKHRMAAIMMGGVSYDCQFIIGDIPPEAFDRDGSNETEKDEVVQAIEDPEDTLSFSNIVNVNIATGGTLIINL